MKSFPPAIKVVSNQLITSNQLIMCSIFSPQAILSNVQLTQLTPSC